MFRKNCTGVRNPTFVGKTLCDGPFSMLFWGSNSHAEVQIRGK